MDNILSDRAFDERDKDSGAVEQEADSPPPVASTSRSSTQSDAALTPTIGEADFVPKKRDSSVGSE